jgi:hypothetical protein
MEYEIKEAYESKSFYERKCKDLSFGHKDDLDRQTVLNERLM